MQKVGTENVSATVWEMSLTTFELLDGNAAIEEAAKQIARCQHQKSGIRNFLLVGISRSFCGLENKNGLPYLRSSYVSFNDNVF